MRIKKAIRYIRNNKITIIHQENKTEARTLLAEGTGFCRLSRVSLPYAGPPWVFPYSFLSLSCSQGIMSRSLAPTFSS